MPWYKRWWYRTMCVFNEKYCDSKKEDSVKVSAVKKDQDETKLVSVETVKSSKRMLLEEGTKRNSHYSNVMYWAK